MNIIHQVLSKTIHPNDMVLDLGCGIKTYSCYGKTITVDAWDKLNPDYLLDLEKEKLPFNENSFDYVLMIDFIEHLEKNKGMVLLEDCKKIVRKGIFVYTPLIFNDNSVNVNNPSCWAFGNKYDYHKSLWSVDDFVGWYVILNDGRTFFGYWKKT